MLSISTSLGVNKTTRSNSAPLIALGGAGAGLGHSFEGAGTTGASIVTGNPQIATLPRNLMQLLASRNPSIRYDVWFGFHYVTLEKTWTVAQPIIGETVSQTATGAYATVIAIPSSGRVVALNTSGISFNTSAINFATSGSIGANPINVVVNVNNLGYSQGLQGDTIQASNGYPGIKARIADLLALPRAPKFIYMNDIINSIIGSNQSAAACLIQQKDNYDALRTAFPDALIFIPDCNCFTVAQGSNSHAYRRTVADYNQAFWVAAPGWSNYNAKTIAVNQFSAAQVGATYNITADNEAFAVGTGGALCTISGTTLTIATGITGALPQSGDVICGPLTGTIVAGTTILSPIVTGSTYQLSNSASVGTNTQFYWGLRLGDPAKFVDSLHYGPGGLWPQIEAMNTWLTPKVAPGDWWWSKYAGVATNRVTSPDANFSGTSGSMSSTGGWAPTGSVPSGLTVSTSGGDGSSALICSIVAGTGESMDTTGQLLPGNNGAPIGANILRLKYENFGSVGDVIKITASNLTAGIFANNATGWGGLYARVRHDNSGILQNIMLQMAFSSNQKSQCLVSNAAINQLGYGLPPLDLVRYLYTPPIEFTASVNPGGIVKHTIQIDGVVSPGIARQGVQYIDILPKHYACQLDNPTI